MNIKINNLNELNEQIVKNFKNIKLLFFYNDFDEDNKEILELINNYLEENEKKEMIIFLCDSEKSENIYKEFNIKEQNFLVFLNPDSSSFREFDTSEPQEIFTNLEEFENQYSSNYDLFLIKKEAILNNYKNLNENLILFDSLKTNENEVNLYKSYNCKLIDINKEKLNGWVQEITNFNLPISINDKKFIQGIDENIKKNSELKVETFFENIIKNNSLIIFINEIEESKNIQDLFDSNKILYSRYNLDNNYGLKNYLIQKFQNFKFYVIFNKELKITNETNLEDNNKFLEILPKEFKEYNMEDKLKKVINSFNVMLFMKGNPQEPKCGFSRKMIGILNNHNINYGHFDILKDNEVRENLKVYSNWKTYPQLYIKGELIGGLDIINEMDYDEFDEMVSEYRK